MFIEIARISWWQDGKLHWGVYGSEREIQLILKSLDKRFPNNKYFASYRTVRVDEHQSVKREKVAA
jgi:hypothetical protein